MVDAKYVINFLLKNASLLSRTTVVSEYYRIAEEAWQRGYEAAVRDAEAVYNTEIAMQQQFDDTHQTRESAAADIIAAANDEAGSLYDDGVI